MRACRMQFLEWQDKFGPTLGLRLAEVTGDTFMTNNEMSEADIILSTPEKWDSVSRKWNEMEAFVGAIKLLMVDEVHFIADEERGATLEATVCRMKYISAWKQRQANSNDAQPLRIMAVSATVPNLLDVGTWLGAPPENICRFGQDFRPVPLSIHVVSGGKFVNEFVFDKGLNVQIPNLIRAHSSGRPTLVFCATRKSSQAAALQLARECAPHLISGSQRQLLQEHMRQITSCQDRDLRECLAAGVGFHNGQLGTEDRRLVETLFTRRALFCLFATSTLAVGANLPAYLVIIKSTIQYRRVAGIAGWAEYDVHSIQQMAGRAGRPGFDTEGRVIIMTQDQHVARYRDVLNVHVMLESRLPAHLTEYLNSEIVLKSIQDIESMLAWADSTFFSVRAKQVPTKYFPELANTGEADQSKAVGRVIRQKLLEGYSKLSSAQPPLCVSKDEDGMAFESTELGRVMAKFCVAFKTMETMGTMLTAQTSMSELLTCLSEAEEFMEFKPRVDQKKFLEECNKKNAAVRYKIEKKANTGGWTGARKVNLLLQLAMGGVTIERPDLRNETTQICDNAARVCEALVEFAISMKWFSTAVRAVKLCQGIKGRCWEDDRNGRLLQQLKGAGDAMSKKLVSSSPPIVTLNDLQTVSIGRLEAIAGKTAAARLLEELGRMPVYSIQAVLEDPEPSSKEASIKLFITCNSSPDTPSFVLFPVLLVGRQDGDIIHHRTLSFAQKASIEITVRVPQGLNQQQILVHVLSKAHVGRDGNALVLIPGSIDAAGGSPVTMKKARRISALKAPQSKPARSMTTQSKAAAVDFERQDVQHHQSRSREQFESQTVGSSASSTSAGSSAKSMLSFLGAKVQGGSGVSGVAARKTQFQGPLLSFPPTSDPPASQPQGRPSSKAAAIRAHSFMAARASLQQTLGRNDGATTQENTTASEDFSPSRRRQKETFRMTPQRDSAELDSLRFGNDIALRRPQRSMQVMNVVNRTFEKSGFGEHGVSPLQRKLPAASVSLNPSSITQQDDQPYRSESDHSLPMQTAGIQGGYTFTPATQANTLDPHGKSAEEVGAAKVRVTAPQPSDSTSTSQLFDTLFAGL